MTFVEDPATGVKFDDDLTLWDGTKLVALGAGTRIVKFAFVPVKVYSIALYVDAEAVKAGGYEAVGKPETKKVVVLELVRTVATKDFVANLRKSLLPRMKGEESSVASLEQGLADKPLEKGARVIIVSRDDGVVLGEAGIEDRTAAYPEPSTYVKSERLKFQLFDLYTGVDSAVPTGRDAWTKRAAELSA